MSAHAFWVTSGCQSLSLVGESVNHQMSTPANSTTKMPSFRQNGLTNTKTITEASARSPATTLFAFPNGASNHTAPNAQATAMMAARRTSSAPAHRSTRIRLGISSVPNSAAPGLRLCVFQFLLPRDDLDALNEIGR